MDSETHHRTSTSNGSLLLVITSWGFLSGVAIGALFSHILASNKKKDISRDNSQSSVPHQTTIAFQEQQNHAAELNATIYFTIASVIQGITIAVLGDAVLDTYMAVSPLDQPLPILTALNSFLISVNFWFAFAMAYFHLFRVVSLRARDHFFLTLVYFSIGLAQIVAFKSIANFRLWSAVTLLMLMILTVYRQYMNHLLRCQQYQRFDAKILYPVHTSLSRVLNLLSAIAVILVTIWYFVSSMDSQLYTFIALAAFSAVLMLVSVNAIRSFQSRLDAMKTVRSEGLLEQTKTDKQ